MLEENELKQLIDRCLAVPDGEALPPEDVVRLRDCVACLPYFYVPVLLLLRHGACSGEEEADLRSRLALAAPDRRTLLFARYGDEWSKFYPGDEEPEAKETVDVIDTFLRTYGSCTPEEEALLEKMIFNPAPDYAEILAREEQENLPGPESDGDDPRQARINAFIRSRHPAAVRPEMMTEPEPAAPDEESEKEPVSRPEHTDDSLLSESLAKIFIKQGRYERAYEIISGLNLKFPKKSAYFADQLRFLQKLIINQRRQKQLNGSGATEK